ncbi:LytR/AlgR family response regulator transcription factor [Rubrivivax rivuli]|uniref:Response regulator transcription factor n=1 Tax=Rubrivivax rivuli TaxID=1862385 RepID=A0A437RCQ3_9BURK|nr:LytTR family DNA-binding domain-containing protein [Rubrivivax rivuli]RVU44484.1 response regulator transcription factor [Rubrivivax rivuli]
MNTPAARALIAEDEPLLAAGLRAELATLWPTLDVVAMVGDGHRAAEQTLALQPDVCFFDIRMPGSTGLEAAQALAEDWPEPAADGSGAPFPLLVFVTAYDDYAVQAFEAQAVDYLVKPVDRQRLAACIARLQARLAQRGAPAAAAPAAVPADALQAAVAQLRALLGSGSAVGGNTPSAPRLEVIQAQVGNLVHLVPVNEVLYFEAADKYVRVVTAQREHLVRASLKELLPQLDPAVFWQVHRGTVVQARAVVTARREESGKVTLTLRGRPETLTVSRLYAHLFKGM